MTNGNGAPATVRLWQVIVGQLPWFITVISLGGWYAAKFDGRMANQEQSNARIEARLVKIEGQIAADQAEKLRQLTEEIARFRRAGR